MTPLADAARAMFAAAVAAVQPDVLVRRLAFDGDGVSFGEARLAPAGRLVVAAVGKAAPGFAAAFLARSVRPPDEVFVLAPDGVEAPAGLPVAIRRGGHPLPDERGAAATRELLALARGLGREDGLLVLLSGGASALLAEPVPGVPHDELRSLVAALLRAGCPIGPLNTVRRHLLAAAGGRLACAAGCPVLTLAVSDVVGDDLPTLASGPTCADPTTCGDALDVVRTFGLAGAFPEVEAVLGAGTGETPKPGDARLAESFAAVIGSSAEALTAAAARAARLGFRATTVTRRLRGGAQEAGAVLAALASAVAAGEPLALLFAGETAVDVRGPGRGGRNLEVALAAAAGLHGTSGRVVLAAGTDGVDGNSPAAGAVVDADTLRRGAMLGRDAALALAASDSWGFFAGLPDALVTGPTGTNVADLAFVLVAGQPGLHLQELVALEQAVEPMRERIVPPGGAAERQRE